MKSDGLLGNPPPNAWKIATKPNRRFSHYLKKSFFIHKRNNQARKNVTIVVNDHRKRNVWFENMSISLEPIVTKLKPWKINYCITEKYIFLVFLLNFYINFIYFEHIGTLSMWNKWCEGMRTYDAFKKSFFFQNSQIFKFSSSSSSRTWRHAKNGFKILCFKLEGLYYQTYWVDIILWRIWFTPLMSYFWLISLTSLTKTNTN